jgi:hypothetical protein
MLTNKRHRASVPLLGTVNSSRSNIQDNRPTRIQAREYGQRIAQEATRRLARRPDSWPEKRTSV